ncbi:sensor domain-containing protein [Pseudoduganella umbonata]|uniref:Diguanylate cyclase (GGDEF)-like protein/PAS domain S-box-containing protein n=1 Tax=Pseudoduganella umbonata TaxID=864828 RepID=A0A4P8HMU5_9BURK|nr:EAL domain-containing protein [Pseudoduganella umbonata]MBB3224721.1 diguanylate cyclase (GGDEF)-like protein/PAS domain S-box-containing protein [Pseudoduganella umbonata]QCP11039.1 EAL domain-containing protein [Pseudoduganella umbonata]
MNPVSSSAREAVIGLTWSTNAEGLCESTCERCPGLLPDMAGLSLPAWIASLAMEGGAAMALQIGAALRHGRPFDYRLEITCHDGWRRHALLTGLPRMAANGHHAGWSGALVDITAHHSELAHALRSEAAHRLIVDNTTDLIARCDPDGRYLHISSSYTRIMGWTPAQMIGQSVIGFLHPDDQAPARERLMRTLAGTSQRNDPMQVRKRTTAGGYVALGTIARQVLDPDTGACLGAVLVSRDIARETEMLARLERMAEQNMTLLESINDGFFSVNGNWEITYANSRAAAFVGVERDAAIGRVVWEVAPGLEESTVGRHLRSAMAHRKDASFEAFYEPVGVWVSERIYAHEDGLSVFFHDISDRVEREKQIRESERRFRETIGITPAGYVLVNGGGIIEDVNPALCQLSGHAREELVGKAVASFLADGDASAALNLRQTGHRVHALETVLLHRQGHRVYALVNQTIEVDADGQPRSLTAFITDITERKHAEARLEEMATRDTLTGLPNRAWINRRVGDMLGGPHHETYTTVFFIDLNRFKEVNDSLGHATGDRLLQQVGERLQSCMRPGDVVARLGGDEFVVAASCAGRDAAAAIAQRLLATLALPFYTDGLEMRVGASIGISLARPGAMSTEQLFEKADTAMYKAKAQGNGSFQFFEPEMCVAAKRRLQLEAALHRALDHGQFEVHYQPRVSLGTMGTLGVEALLRWDHPEFGRVAPLEFIPLAEERGHIGTIGQWVLGAACRDVKRINDRFGMALHVSVNVSARQLRSPDLVAQVQQALAGSGLPAAALELELTESALIEDLDQSAEVLRGLKSLGVRLSIDDFGTGYSSLSYLKRFPIDVLKLDRSFVAESPAGDGFVRAVIGMAHALNLSVVAEGIETTGTMAALRDAACDEGQGYLFARPMPLEELEAFLADEETRSGNALEQESAR